MKFKTRDLIFNLYFKTENLNLPNPKIIEVNCTEIILIRSFYIF